MAQKLSFAENFALSGCAAVISKTAAAPIERIKLLIQNQDEMIKQVITQFSFLWVINFYGHHFRGTVRNRPKTILVRALKAICRRISAVEAFIGPRNPSLGRFNHFRIFMGLGTHVVPTRQGSAAH